MIPTLASLALGLALGQVVYLDYLWNTRSVLMPPPPPPDPEVPELEAADPEHPKMYRLYRTKKRASVAR